MTYNNNYYKKEFIPKLKIGQIWEKQAIAKINEYYDNKFVLLHTLNTNEYDFKLSNNIKYEVKFDGYSLKTGNIFIEFLQFNKDSGITITKADYYIIILPNIINKYLLVDVLELNFLIITNQYKSIYTDKFKSGYLFDISIIQNSSIQL
jgi:hypothetical protein